MGNFFSPNGQPLDSFSFIFALFEHHFNFVTNSHLSILWWKSNSRSFEHKSPPFATRPGLPESGFCKNILVVLWYFELQIIFSPVACALKINLLFKSQAWNWIYIRRLTGGNKEFTWTVLGIRYKMLKEKTNQMNKTDWKCFTSKIEPITTYSG